MPRKSAKPNPKKTSRQTPEARDRAGRILLEREAGDALATARRHGVSRWTVYSIWEGRRWHLPDRAGTVVLAERARGEWVPATSRDETLLRGIVGSGQDGRIADLVALCADHGLAVVFRGDLVSPAAPKARPRQ